MHNTTASTGSIKDIQWSDVQVGNLLLVRDDELLPADILCLYSDIPERVCYIKTTNLVRDGQHTHTSVDIMDACVLVSMMLTASVKHG